MAPILWALCSKEKSGANTNRLLICRSILFELNSVLYNSFLVLGCHSNQNRVHLYPELLALANKSLYCTLSCLWWHQVGRLNWFWWKYLHHKIWQALQRRTFFSFLESQLLKKKKNPAYSQSATLEATFPWLPQSTKKSRQQGYETREAHAVCPHIPIQNHCSVFSLGGWTIVISEVCVWLDTVMRENLPRLSVSCRPTKDKPGDQERRDKT